MSASEVQICNLALLKFGDITISSLSESTKQGRACKVYYQLMVEELLYSHPWNFAITRADISAQLSTTPSFEFDYAYKIPSDCLRVLEFYGSELDWTIEGENLLTNAEEEVYIRYIKRITESGEFTPIFVKCLSILLGAELAAKLADDKKMRQILLDELKKEVLPEAKRLNAIEGRKPKSKEEQALDEGNFSWQNEGR